MKRAEEIVANLAPQFPSMIKCMLPSFVSGGWLVNFKLYFADTIFLISIIYGSLSDLYGLTFWMQRLGQKFCKDHLPKEDTEIVLEDESGESLETVYHAHKMGLSGGWKKFTMTHRLSEGDVVVFHLVKPTKFKVNV